MSLRDLGQRVGGSCSPFSLSASPGKAPSMPSMPGTRGAVDGRTIGK
jgi:hypothetical protein